MKKKVKIYALLCPINKDVKYIGKTFGTLKDRLSKHFNSINDNSKKKDWIIESIKSGNYPEIVLIEEVDSFLANLTEQKWISHYGIENLLNHNRGGGGCSIIGYDDFLYKYKIFLTKKYSKNTVYNYVSCIKIFLNYYNQISRPKNINKEQIEYYLNTIDSVNTRNIALSSIKLFYTEIINQPKKLKSIKYKYK